MTAYVALLRGINVGGAKPIAMAKLVTVFEGAGFANVRTYIASGNVMFETAKTDPRKLEVKIEKALAKVLPGCKVVVRSRDEVAAIIAGAPWKKLDPKLRYNVMFLREAVDSKQILAKLKPDKGETIEYAPGVLYTSSASTQDLMVKLTRAKVGDEITVRGLATVHKLLALLPP